MPFFRYIAVNPEGKKVRGILESIHYEEALARLQTQGITILSLRSSKKALRKASLKASELTFFAEQLASLLAAGMPLYESLCEIAKQHLEDPFYPTLAGLCEHIKQGLSLAEAMRFYPNSFSNTMVAMVEAGQAGGKLASTLSNLAILLQKEQKVGKQFLSALLYPLILLSFSLLLILILLLFVIPSLEMLFEDRSVNVLTSLVMGASRLLRQGYPFLLIGLGAGGLAFWRYRQLERGKENIEKILLRLPLVRTLMIQKELGKFAYLMGMMLGGGVPLLKALQTCREVIKVRHLKALFLKAEQKVMEGNLLSQELKQSPYIPPLFSRLIAIGEEGGNLQSMFQNISQLYETEVDHLLSRIVTLAQPVMLIGMGLIVGIIMLAVLLPLTDINAFI